VSESAKALAKRKETSPGVSTVEAVLLSANFARFAYTFFSYGSGCTSGHGVCGLGRFSLRSLVAVALFMASGIAAAVITRHVLGVQS
jgi:hypothetical protein